MEASDDLCYFRGGFKLRKPLPVLPEGKYIDVTCGLLRGRLHRELFICPGIRRECIELENGEFVTPKKFMFMGEKARLKDWKNAVRISGVQVRKYIDAGELTFWNHDMTCTGRCQARTPFNRNTLTNSSPPSSTSTAAVEHLSTVTEGGVMQIQNVKGGDHVKWEVSSNYMNEVEEEDVKPDIAQLQLQMLGNVSQAQKQIQNTLAKAAIKPVPICLTANNTVSYPDMGGETTDEEDRTLWKGIVELGLVDEFFREIKASLDVLKNNMVRRMVPLEDTKKISVIVKQLGLMSKLKYKLEAHQTDMERQRMRLDREMEELQRKVREYELKKEMLKRKSDCFNQLLDMAKKEDGSPESKRPCSNGPSQIVFPTTFPLPPSLDELRSSDNSPDLSIAKSGQSESRRKQKTTEKVVITNPRNERDSVELEYLNGDDYEDDTEDDNAEVLTNGTSAEILTNGVNGSKSLDTGLGKIQSTKEAKVASKSKSNGDLEAGETGQGNSENKSLHGSNNVKEEVTSPLTRIRKTGRTRRSVTSDKE